MDWIINHLDPLVYTFLGLCDLFALAFVVKLYKEASPEEKDRLFNLDE